MQGRAPLNYDVQGQRALSHTHFPHSGVGILVARIAGGTTEGGHLREFPCAFRLTCTLSQNLAAAVAAVGIRTVRNWTLQLGVIRAW